MINYDEVRLALRHIWIGTLDESCSFIKWRVDQGVRDYLFIEERTDVGEKLSSKTPRCCYATQSSVAADFNANVELPR